MCHTKLPDISALKDLTISEYDDRLAADPLSIRSNAIHYYHSIQKRIKEMPHSTAVELREIGYFCADTCRSLSTTTASVMMLIQASWFFYLASKKEGPANEQFADERVAILTVRLVQAFSQL